MAPDSSGPLKPTGADLLVSSLISHGVDTIFGLPGAQLDHVFDSLCRARDRISVIHTRHEQATAYMAFGYAQAARRPGVSLVVPGPGALNATAALSTAYACNAPVMFLTSQVPSAHIDGGLGYLHEIPGQLQALASVTKWQGRVSEADDVGPITAEAFRRMASGRKRPVALELPPDIAARRSIAPKPTAPLPLLPDPAPDPDAVAAAARIMTEARSPAIFVGGGALDAGELLARLAGLLQAPVVMSEHGMGALDPNNPFAQTMQVGNDLWPRFDAVLAVGTRLFHPIADWGRDDAIRLARIDIDPEQSKAQWPPDAHIVADAQVALTELIPEVEKRVGWRSDRSEEFARVKAAKHAELAARLAPQEAFTQALRAELPDDGIVCFDVCQLHFYSWYGWPVRKPHSVIQPGYQGTLGYGYPTALGAKVGAPDRPVVYVGGDGGFMFNVQELSTALRFGLKVVAVVFNDNAFGNVRRTQMEQFGGRLIASDLRNPDFGKLADSFGMRFGRTSTPEGLRVALREALRADEPALIEVQYGDFPNPFPSMFFRKVRG
jgi:acetolactate synthase-1/2/3 large subunit